MTPELRAGKFEGTPPGPCTRARPAGAGVQNPWHDPRRRQASRIENRQQRRLRRLQEVQQRRRRPLCGLEHLRPPQEAVPAPVQGGIRACRAPAPGHEQVHGLRSQEQAPIRRASGRGAQLRGPGPAGPGRAGHLLGPAPPGAPAPARKPAPASDPQPARNGPAGRRIRFRSRIQGLPGAGLEPRRPCRALGLLLRAGLPDGPAVPGIRRVRGRRDPRAGGRRAVPVVRR